MTAPFNTLLPRPTPLTTPNGTGIQSAVLPQYTFRTDRSTDGLGDEPVRIPAYTLLAVYRRARPSNTLIPQPTPLPPKTASGSSQPFYCSTLYGPTHSTHTDIDRWDRRQDYNNSAYALLVESNALKRCDRHRQTDGRTELHTRSYGVVSTIKRIGVNCYGVHLKD